jgi:hypothetical protein
MSEETTAKLLAVNEVSPTTELTTQMTRTNPDDGDTWEGVEDTIAFPDDKNYMKVNNTEKMYYDHVTYNENDISFRAIKRGVLEDFLVGNYHGDGIDPRNDLPDLQAKMGAENPIHNIINYQAAIETGLSSYDWYDWLYDKGMYLQLAYEPKNPAKGNTDQPEWGLKTYRNGRSVTISTIQSTGGNLATIVTAAPHGFSTGDTVTVWVRGSTYTMFNRFGATITVVNSTTFTYAYSGLNYGPVSNDGNCYKEMTSKNLSTVARSSNVATVVTTAAHQLITGDKVDINAVDNTFDENNVTITYISSTSFSYANTGGDVSTKSDAGTCIKSGPHDTDFIRWAASIVSFCSPDGDIIYLRPMSEMNGDWVTWGTNWTDDEDSINGNSVSSDDYIQAWQYLYNLFAREGANTYLKWIWCPVAPLSTSDATDCWDDLYPGDSYVDIIGMNGYNFGDISWSYWRSFDEIYAYGYDYFTSQQATKDFYICEIGCNATGGNKVAWMVDAFDKLRNDYTRFVACTWFNMTEPTDSTIDYRWDENASTIKAYKEGIVFRRECAWSGTDDCIHRVKHAIGSPVVGMGSNPPDTKPIVEKVATLSLEGDILQNIPISGDLWMYFENMTYIEGDTWVTVALPKPTLSQDIYDGDILNQNLGNIFGNPSSVGNINVTGLTNSPPPAINITEETVTADSLAQMNPQLGAVQGGSATFGNPSGQRLEVAGNGQTGWLAAYNGAGERTVQVNDSGVAFWMDGAPAGVLQAGGTATTSFSMETLSDGWEDDIAFGNNYKQRIAQQFLTTEACTSAYFRVKVSRNVNRPLHSVIVRVRADSSNSPGTILATTNFYPATSYPTYYNIELSVSLANATKYWLEFDSSVYINNTWPLFIWGENDADDYTSGLCKGYNGTWNNLANHDIGLELYKLTASPIIEASANFRVAGNLEGVARKVVIPLIHGGGYDAGGTSAWSDPTRRNSTVAIGSGGLLLEGAETYYDKDDYEGEALAWYFEACIMAGGGGASVSCILRDWDNTTNLAVLTTTSTAWLTLSSSQLSMPGSATTLRVGLRTSNSGYWAYVNQAYLLLYMGAA